MNVLKNALETSASLATHFKVDARTIRRDLSVLQTKGFIRHDEPDKGQPPDTVHGDEPRRAPRPQPGDPAPGGARGHDGHARGAGFARPGKEFALLRDDQLQEPGARPAERPRPS